MTLRRKSGLSRENAGLKRSKGLAKGSGRLKQTRRQKARVSPETRRIALARNGGRCACGCGQRSVQVHHVLPKSKWKELVDVPENCVGIAVRCHSRHEQAVKRIPRQGILCVLPLISDGSMERYIERTYPVA